MVHTRKILVIEDVQNLAKAVKSSLEFHGVNVLVGLGGPQGPKLAGDEKPKEFTRE